MTTPVPGPGGSPGEVTGLASAQAYASAMTSAYTNAASDAESFAAGLGGSGVSGPAVAALGRAQELTVQAGAAWAAAGHALDQQTAVKEAYMSAPTAGSKQFVTDGATTDGGPPAAATVPDDGGPYAGRPMTGTFLVEMQGDGYDVPLSTGIQADGPADLAAKAQAYADSHGLTVTGATYAGHPVPGFPGTAAGPQQSTDEPAAAGGTSAAAFRCDTCGHVMVPPPPQDGTANVEPAGCRYCRTTNTTFSPTTVFYPDQPSDAARERDTRDVETAVRDAYAQLATRPGFGVPLADLREALPAEYDRETVDAALSKLMQHSDVSITPDRSHVQADERTQRAALATGGGYDDTLRIYPDYSIHDTLQRVSSTTRTQAESILAQLSDDKVAWIAEQMGVDTAGNPAELRDRVAERSDHNRTQWLADAEQERLDGTLLARADNEPEWVATWGPQQREDVRAAAQRLLAKPERLENWYGIRERIDRWL